MPSATICEPETKIWTNRALEGVEVGNLTAMLLAALRDMQWRRRRLVIAIISTGLIFAMTLVLTGLTNGRCGRAVPRFDTVRPGRRGAGGRRARSGGRGPPGAGGP